MKTEYGKALEAYTHNRIDYDEFQRRLDSAPKGRKKCVEIPVEPTPHEKIVKALNEIYKLDPEFDSYEADEVIKTGNGEEELLIKYREIWKELNNKGEKI